MGSYTSETGQEEGEADKHRRCHFPAPQYWGWQCRRNLKMDSPMDGAIAVSWNRARASRSIVGPTGAIVTMTHADENVE